MNKESLVFDTFALLVLFYKEPGFIKIEKWLKQAENNERKIFFSEINWGELYYRVWKNFGKKKALEILLLVKQLPIELVGVNSEFILGAAKWKALYSVSYADAFAVELAYQKKCKVVTGDPEFDKVKNVDVVWVGK